ncbi:MULTISPECIES: hypothetical protein [unclassified Brevundimonas]|uniref:hypothetical protein n=1 Tax=unclassified Brevundimonas TaxID=2622653 RepID=UPI000E81C210|nr:MULTISPECIES: hypothetical protein [unclassified Brevundimonas]HBY43712.1 hypothetical protein [Brevundimonas sp.]
MRAKLMTSAAVLAGALAFAGMAQAQSSNGPNGPVGGNTTATDSYNSGGNSTDVDLGVADSFNDNSDNSTDLDVGISDSLNDNSDNSTNTNLELGVSDSFNDNSDNSTNTEVGISDSFNTDASTNTDNSVNTNLELGVSDSFNDNSVNDSGNDNSTNIGDIRVSLNMQELSANVSDLSFDMSEDGQGPQNARIRTGNINQSGGAFAGFAGIQTVSNNTGMASVGQAATAISANANITFGNGGGN